MAFTDSLDRFTLRQAPAPLLDLDARFDLFESLFHSVLHLQHATRLANLVIRVKSIVSFEFIPFIPTELFFAKPLQLQCQADI